MSKYKAVLFDFDGTLMDTNDIILGSWDHVFNIMAGRGVDRTSIVTTFGETLRDCMPRFFPDKDPDECVETYRDYQRHIFEGKLHMFPGTHDWITNLKERGIKVAVVTSRLWTSVYNDHYDFDLADSFDALVTASDTDVHKPHPYPIQLCLEKLGMEAKDAIYIGDSRFDIQCAHNAGMEAVLVDWTICLPEEQRVGISKPDYVVKKAEDLYPILGIEL